MDEHPLKKWADERKQPDELEALKARVSMLEMRVHAGREQSVAGLAWGIAGLCLLAAFAILWYGAKLIGG